ncbi:MFS transporter [Halomicroarcula sp. GCM10025324]|uniref:MFS transporter n=1 Tax=Haloarcula TaxID=2237 RepID=UPI0023E79994|nr:MFS transporter [Halomicroarcula sp. ZS-22-S1]
MRFVRYVRQGQWATVFGYLLFIALMAAGYYYNVTFVQLGLIDLGVRLVGMTRVQVSMWMAALALLTFVTAVVVGIAMDRRGWSSDLRTKLRLLFGVVVVQFVLTAVAPSIHSVPAFGAWIIVGSISLGVGFPVSFSLAIDLIPVPDRGYVAAVITSVAYFAANAYPLEWSVDVFSRLLTIAMIPGIVVLAVLVSERIGVLDGVLDSLSEQHEQFGRGRFCHPTPVRTRSLALWSPVVLMFGVFFIDSLGFLRIIETPSLVLSSWQSPVYSTRLAIALVHVVGALMAGVLYVNFDRNALFLWVFALFSLTYVLYTTDLRVASLFPGLVSNDTAILNPLLYALTVSFYTTLNFALWPDLSTAETVGTHSAIGIGMAGWLATFLSTAVSLFLEDANVGLLSHLNLVNALALLLFVGLIVTLYGTRLVRYAREAESG